MILYKNFKWQQEDFIVSGLPIPRNCPHCNGSAILYGDGRIECQKPYYEKSEACGYNHYDTTSPRRSIELWNKYDDYSKVKYEEWSDVHYFLAYNKYPEDD